jgi:hypothetical protein
VLQQSDGFRKIVRKQLVKQSQMDLLAPALQSRAAQWFYKDIASILTPASRMVRLQPLR